MRISYKAVMHNSMSNYSEEAIVDVGGSKELLGYPEQVMGWHESIDEPIDTYFEDDLREGYAGHAVSYFSWIKPNSMQGNVPHNNCLVYTLCRLTVYQSLPIEVALAGE